MLMSECFPAWKRFPRIIESRQRPRLYFADEGDQLWGFH